MPRRIQRKRQKGWQLPSGAVVVTRPTKWGNPFTEKDARQEGRREPHAWIVHSHRQWLKGAPGFADRYPEQRARVLEDIEELRGKILCCWCRPEQECHADALIELANR
jgi:hypothetical protein